MVLIRKGFAHLRPGKDYDRLYDAALAAPVRTDRRDQCYPALFCALRRDAQCGARVMSPTLALLVKREQGDFVV